MFKPHDCGDSRLKCIDCDGIICPKCFIQCPVGNRCKQCSSKFTSHVLQVTPVGLLKMGATALALGAGFGAAQAVIPGGGFFMWLVVYWIGVAAGNIIHKVGGFKIGMQVLVTVSVAVFVGWYAMQHVDITPPDEAPSEAQLAAAIQPAMQVATKDMSKEEAEKAQAKALEEARKQQVQLVAAQRDAMKKYRASSGMIDLIIFLAGIITVVSGQVPQLRFPFWGGSGRV